MDRKHGISLYPDKRSMTQQINYIQKARKLGYKYVFATMHQPELSMSEQLEFISEIASMVHDYGMSIVVDIRGSFIKEMSQNNVLSHQFKSLQVEAIRIDFEMEPSLLQSIKELGVTEVFINSSVVNEKTVIEYKGYCEEVGLTLKGCHNFYPRPETGLSSVKYLRQEMIFKSLGIENWTFVPNLNNPRGPIFEGLPTLEKHRRMSTSEAALDLLTNYGTENILIGDGLADEVSLKSLQEGDIINEITLRIKVFNESLVEPLLNKVHPIRMDSGEFQIRLEGIRQMASHSGLAIEPNNTIERGVGSITIDNSGYKRYEGETQIIIKDLPMDERVNVVAQVIDDDVWSLPYLNGENTIEFRRV